MNLDELLVKIASIASTVLAPRSEVVDRRGEWPEEGIRALQVGGFGGLVIPRVWGGLGHGLLAVARVCEELGRHCPTTAISFGMHLVGSAVLAAKPTDEQREQYLEPIVRGQHLTTLALSEPGSGAHFYIPQARLSADGEGFLVTGQKSFVTNGGYADSYVLSVTSAHHEEPGEFSCVIVPQDTPGLTWGPRWEGWGMRGNSAISLELSGVPLQRGHLLGHEGDEIWYVFRVIAPYFLMAMAGTYCGIGLAAIEEARKHLQNRVHAHAGAPLGHSPVLQHRLGTLWAMVQRTKALMYAAATSAEAGSPEALPLLLSAKAEVADAMERVTAEVMTLMGGRGYAHEAKIHRLYRDVRAAHVMAPTTDMLRTWTGRALLELPILGD